MSLPFNDLRLKPGEQPNAERLAELFEAIQSDFEYLDTKNAQASILTSLPTKSVVGRRILYKAAAGVYWQLLYTGEETYPWAKIGGPPLVARSDTGRASNETTYKSLPTDPLSITVPLAGDYDITIAAAIYNVAANRTGWLSYEVGGTAASDNWAATFFSASAGTASTALTTRQTAITASAAITEKAKRETGEVQFFRRRLIIDPVRVG